MNQNYFFQSNNPSFVVTKANVLKLLQKKLKKSKIEKIIVLTFKNIIGSYFILDRETRFIRLITF